MSNILITGVGGFVGSALCEKLLADGAHVVGIHRDWVKAKPLPGKTVVHGNVLDADFCQRIITDYEIDTVYHLAAQAIVSHCAQDPITALEVAVLGTARLLQAVREAGRPITVVVSTSDKVYGHAPSPYTEETPLDARHAYEVSKACQDLTARMYFHNFGVDVRVVRAVNIYGPGDPNESRVVPQTITRILRREPPIIHAGAHSMRRQYIYIDDLVSAFRTVAAHGVPGEAYCVGSLDAPMSVAEVIHEIQRQMTQVLAPEVRDRPAQFKEIAEQSVRDDKLRAGWTPRVHFVEGVRRTIEWYKARQ